MRLVINNNENEYKKDIESGIGFRITNPDGISKKDKKRAIDGIYSPLFGADLSEPEAEYEMYSCECKDLKGRFFEGVTCSKCSTKVQLNNTDLAKTGWIVMDDYKCINPLFYPMLEKIFGKSELNRMLKFNKTIDAQGNIKVEYDEEIDNSNPNHGMGLIEFHNQFDELMKEVEPNAPKDIFKFVTDHRDSVFIQHIPIYSLVMRPIVIIRDTMIFSDINKLYAMLVSSVANLNRKRISIDKKIIKVLPILYNIQTLLNEINSMIIKLLSGKKGHIRGNMLGIRINFSSRCVIVPLLGKEYELDNVVLPYLACLELYKFHIINLLCKSMTINDAHNRWEKATEKFDKKIYLLMKHIIKNTKGGVHILINRPPTINHGSILLMKVVDIKQDYNDLTMAVPIGILGPLAGDFDGDVLTIVSLLDRKMVESLEVFNPKQLMIDRNNGRFNRKMSLIKDQMIGLHAYCK